jgi:hypothetical protein
MARILLSFFRYTRKYVHIDAYISHRLFLPKSCGSHNRIELNFQSCAQSWITDLRLTIVRILYLLLLSADVRHEQFSLHTFEPIWKITFTQTLTRDTSISTNLYLHIYVICPKDQELWLLNINGMWLYVACEVRDRPLGCCRNVLVYISIQTEVWLKISGILTAKIVWKSDQYPKQCCNSMYVSCWEVGLDWSRYVHFKLESN